MTIYKIISDIHLDYRTPNQAEEVVKLICEEPTDALILAGDITSHDKFDLLDPLYDAFPKVYYVFGNHEYAGLRFPDDGGIPAELKPKQDYTTSGDMFDDGAVSGATLWYDLSEKDRRTTWPRFYDGFSSINLDPGRLFWEHCSWLSDRPAPVIVTHHLPSLKSIHPKYQQAPYNAFNPFFATSMEGLVRKLAPRLWVHGHTHMPTDYYLGSTRIVCNPLGYPGEGTARDNVFNFTVEVESES